MPDLGVAVAMAGAHLDAVRGECASLQTRLQQAGLTFRAPPTEPTTCCGKGCQGCVWEGFYAASAYWVEGAVALIKQS